MAKHISTRVTDDFMEKLDFMAQLKGKDSVSELVREYVEAGLQADAKDIEAQVQARMEAERQRMERIVTAFQTPVASTEPEAPATEAAGALAS